MTFDTLKENLSGGEKNMRSYLESSQEYYRLKAFKFLMQGLTSFSKILLIGAVGLLTLLFLSLATAFGLGQLLNNTFFGFLIVGVFYVALSIILYVLRSKLDGPLLRKFSEFYFDDL
ncbi:MAG TPA: hypothetical protein VKN36_07065 [Eudoraea sp.]|nr:hypothetical protein [Eudoraea sp.]